MGEFVLMVMIYANTGGGFQFLQMGEYPNKAECEQYSKQVMADLKEPTRTLRGTCLPKSSLNRSNNQMIPPKGK